MFEVDSNQSDPSSPKHSSMFYLLSLLTSELSLHVFSTDLCTCTLFIFHIYFLVVYIRLQDNDTTHTHTRVHTLSLPVSLPPPSGDFPQPATLISNILSPALI